MHTIPRKKNKIFLQAYVLRNILEKLRLFHCSFQEVDGLTLPEEQPAQRRLVPIRPARQLLNKRKGMCGSFLQALVGEERMTNP